RLEHILRDARPACILTDTNTRDSIMATDIPIITCDEMTWSLPPESFSIHTRVENINSRTVHHRGDAYIMYTSGSSGSPKGVIVGREALSTFLVSIKGVI